MTVPKRILIEVLGPPFLGAVLLSVFRGMWGWREFSFVLFCAYLFGIVPSCIYAVVMELWIQGGGARKCGGESTVALSTLFGLVVGVMFLFTLDPDGGLLLIGLVVGFLLGLVLAVCDQHGDFFLSKHFPRSALMLAKRIIFICVWTVVYFFGSTMFLGFVSGLYLVVSLSMFGQQPSEQASSWIGMSWAIVPMVLGLVGLVLGILGRLPGTRRKSG